MYASVHADRSGRVLISTDHGAAGMGGATPAEIASAIPLPAGTRVAPLPREAIALDRAGRPRPLGRDRLAMGACLPRGYTRLLFPAYQDDRSAAALDRIPYAAVAADAAGQIVVAATGAAEIEANTAAPSTNMAGALRRRPANALARQLARCARDHACVAARAAIGHGDLPVPLGAPSAERPRAPIDMRSGYAGSPTERAAFKPTAAEIAQLAADHIERGGTGLSFGRACDGEPLARVRVLEAALTAVREHAPGIRAHLETCGADPDALRRALDAGVTSVTVRIGTARPDTYDTLHGPVAHRWKDVRASLATVSDRGTALRIALLVLPGLTDRGAEIDALGALLGELRGGELELRDLGCDPLRTLALFPRGRPAGVAALLARLAEADHFRRPTATELAAV